LNSDDLAKNLASIYNKQLSKSPSPISGSEGNLRAAESVNFSIYPGLDNADEDGEELLSQSFDINFAQEGSFFRFRTNTDAKIDRISEIKRKQGNVKTVKCDDNFVKFNEEIHDDDGE
jgi:Stress-activated map kinase interacting protein 1 (SIN1)